MATLLRNLNVAANTSTVISASHALNSNNSVSALNSLTASYTTTAITASYAVSAETATTALTASYIIGGGSNGSNGTSGTSGAAGASGAAGTSGTSGVSGASGAAGTDGSSGTSGVSGTAGTSGASGAAGADGSSGTSGASGAAGSSGTSGASGAAGSSGTSGASGAAGSSGTSGSAGTSGTTGASGSSGTSGSAGTSGSSGANGSSGTSGTAGSSGNSVSVTTSDTAPINPSTGSLWWDTTTGDLKVYYFNVTGSWVAASSAVSGTAGTSGSSGTSGTTGTSGSSGTSGSAGTAGSSGTSGASFVTGSTYNVTSSWANSASYFSGVSNGTINYVAKFTGANTIGSSSIFESGSNVGIGTSSPSAKLDIGSTASAGTLSGLIFSGLNSTSTKADYVKMSGVVEFNVAASEGGGYKIQVLQQGAYKDSIVASGITNNSTNYLALSTTNEAVRITSTGNVGIGTTSPLATLDVNTSGTTNYQNVANFFQPSQPDSQLMSISIGQSAVSGKEALIGFYKGTSAASYSNSYMALNIFGDSWGSGLVLAKGGNVGIGTTSPSYKLSISAGTVTGGIFVQDSDSASASPVIRVQGNRSDTNSSQGFSGGLVLERYMSNGSTGLVNGNVLGTIYFGGNYNTTPTYTYPASISAVAEANWTSTSAAAAGLAFYTGATGQSLSAVNTSFGTERMRIDSNGNVGIGITGSGTKLDVNGNGRFMQNAAATTGAIILRQAASDAEGAFIQWVNNANAVEKGWLTVDTSSNMKFATVSTERMRIDSSGNVGIGTSSPGYKLEVNGALAFSQFANSKPTNSQIPVIYAAQSLSGFNYGDLIFQGRQEPSNNAHIVFLTGVSSTERMRVSGNGNVGIGTSSPAQRLHVQSGTATVTPITTTSVTGDTAYQAILVTKFDNDSTTSQNFIQFQINNGGANCGKITANGANTAAFGSTSDRRVKENIADLPSQLANIMALRPVEFDYVESYGGGHQIGFVAQEMQQVYPDVIAEDSSEEKILSITGWSKTEARLVKAMQEQQALIANLTTRLAALETK
jgi:hypothetical protein